MASASGNDPRPSVYEVIAFLAAEWVWKMPTELCALCSKPILPPDPLSAEEAAAKAVELSKSAAIGV